MRKRERENEYMGCSCLVDFRSETENQKAPKNSFIQYENGG